MVIECINNLEDLERVRQLEAAGKLWKGAWTYCVVHMLATMWRLDQLTQRPPRALT